MRIVDASANLCGELIKLRLHMRNRRCSSCLLNCCWLLHRKLLQNLSELGSTVDYAHFCSGLCGARYLKGKYDRIVNE